MTEDTTLGKAKFDALLQRLIQSKPTTLEQTKAKLRKREPRRPRKISVRRDAVDRSS
jgi:hypothetical protein